MAGLPEYELSGFQIPTTKYPARSESLKSIMGSQLGIAGSYRDNLANTSDQLAGQYNKQSRMQLADTIKQTRNDFNRRGLLRSGMRMGAESGAKSAAASDQDAYRYNTNSQLLNNANNLEGNAMNTGLLYTGGQPGLGSGALAGTQLGINNQIQDMQNQQQIFNGAGQGLGNLAGSIAANARQKQAGGVQ